MAAIQNSKSAVGFANMSERDRLMWEVQKADLARNEARLEIALAALDAYDAAHPKAAR